MRGIDSHNSSAPCYREHRKETAVYPPMQAGALMRYTFNTLDHRVGHDALQFWCVIFREFVRHQPNRIKRLAYICTSTQNLAPRRRFKPLAPVTDATRNLSSFAKSSVTNSMDSTGYPIYARVAKTTNDERPTTNAVPRVSLELTATSL